MNVGGYLVIAAAIIAAAIVSVGVVSTIYGAVTTTVTVPETTTVTETLPVPVTETGTLNSTEAEALLYMIEEEKLARDVYTYFADKYGTAIFVNIAVSEQNHMDAVLQLIEKYGLNITLGDYGEFNNEHIQELYDQLIAMGNQSLEDALKVGALIEETDIKDLQEWLTKVDNPDIIQVFEYLMRGSRNHLRAFVSTLENMFGVKYEPQVLSQEEYEQIINSSMETGNSEYGHGPG